MHTKFTRSLFVVSTALGILIIVWLMMALTLSPGPIAQAAPTGNLYDVSGSADSTGSCVLIFTVYSCPSLRAAVIAANAHPGSIIQLTHGTTYTLSIAPSGADDATTGDLNINADVTFQLTPAFCLSHCGATIQGGPGWQDRIMTIASSAHVSAFMLTIRNGNVTGDGGGLRNLGHLTLNYSTIIRNTASLNGGGLANTGTITLTGGTIISNTTTGFSSGGGGIYNQGVMNLLAVNIVSNTTVADGGGINNAASGTLQLNNSEVVDNDSYGAGGLWNEGRMFVDGGAVRGNRSIGNCLPICVGGIYNEGQSIITGTLIITNGGMISTLTNMSVMQLSNLTVTQNNGNYGGANLGHLVIDHCAFLTNTATSDGGAMVNEGLGVMTITNSILRGNLANGTTSSGGAIFNLALAHIDHSDISDNHATGNGGGIDSHSNTLYLSHSTVHDNTAQGNGGGIATRDDALVYISHSTLRDNTAQGNGGGVGAICYIYCPAMVLSNSTLGGNSTPGDGGGIYTESVLTITQITLDSNHADGHGGGLAIEINPHYANGPTIAVVDNVTLSNNIADYDANYVGDGGAVAVISGTLTLLNSTVVNNHAANGGGLSSTGLLDLTNSTLSDNYADNSGGGLISTDASASAYVNNVTIAHNQADTNNDGIGKGGGIAVMSGTFSIRNTLIGQNSDISEQAPDCSGTLTTDRYNLIQNTTGCTLTGNLIGNITGQNPLIGPLQNNGGSTWTHALLSNSPAINAGNPTAPGSGLAACLTIDQRGLPRPVGGRCDIGAFEYGAMLKMYLPLIKR